jgi:hypothetical protein
MATFGQVGSLASSRNTAKVTGLARSFYMTPFWETNMISFDLLGASGMVLERPRW